VLVAVSCCYLNIMKKKYNSSLKVDRIVCLVNTVIPDTDKHR